MLRRVDYCHSRERLLIVFSPFRTAQGRRCYYKRARRRRPTCSSPPALPAPTASHAPPPDAKPTGCQRPSTAPTTLLCRPLNLTPPPNLLPPFPPLSKLETTWNPGNPPPWGAVIRHLRWWLPNPSLKVDEADATLFWTGFGPVLFRMLTAN